MDLKRFVLVDDDPNVPGYECQLAPMVCIKGFQGASSVPCFEV